MLWKEEGGKGWGEKAELADDDDDDGRFLADEEDLGKVGGQFLHARWWL